ncbi:L,D-transpeptidase [Acidithiobacillus sp. IBUN Pt1247-S3]|uniref:L,D-transpeptidase n=1 Tax=Acidithiobacillus sp. IBUN Pt1247-S3 TaxID=3166642 RepID=UPI0034E592A0
MSGNAPPLFRKQILTLCILPVLGGFSGNVLAADGVATSPHGWQWVWQKLARYGYVHVVYGSYMGRYGGEHTVAAWDVVVPPTLQRLSNTWGHSAMNPEFRSGVIQFERATHILPFNNISRGRVTATLVDRLDAGNIPQNPYPFQWVEVRKNHHPEQLRVWQVLPSSATAVHWRGHWKYHSVCNTGVLHSTPDGTWPVYQRLADTTMHGTFPVPISKAEYLTLSSKQRGHYHGHLVYWQKYVAPNVRFVNYFYNGRAIHFYPRKSYGWPQSAGCVEMPYKNAEHMFHLLHYGDLVSIVGKYQMVSPEKERLLLAQESLRKKIMRSIQTQKIGSA